MSLLKGLTQNAAIADEKDSVGGGGLFDSGVYDFTVTMAFLQKSKGGALGVVLSLETADKRKLRQTVYVTSGDAKGNKNTYLDKDQKEQYLPGYLQINSLCRLAIGKELVDLEDEEKVVKIYDFDAKSEVPKKVPVLTELLGAKIKAGVIKQTVDKNVETAPGSKVYVPSGDTREENEIDKFFRADDGMTTAEILAGAAEANFINTWTEKWAGKVKDKTSKDKAATGAAGAPKPAAAAAKPKSSLFSKPAASAPPAVEADE